MKTNKNQNQEKSNGQKLFICLLISGILMLISALTSMAQSSTKNNKVDVQLTAQKQVRVWYMNAENEKVSIWVINSKGDAVEKRSFRCEGNMKVKFDFGRLPVDTYTIQVFKNKELVRAEQVNLDKNHLCSMPYLIEDNQSQLATGNQ